MTGKIFLKSHNLTQNMSCSGNCHDNAVAESFFQSLKREIIRRKVYLTRDEGKADVFDYIEMFYNPKRHHSSSGEIQNELTHIGDFNSLLISVKTNSMIAGRLQFRVPA